MAGRRLLIDLFAVWAIFGRAIDGDSVEACRRSDTLANGARSLSTIRIAQRILAYAEMVRNRVSRNVSSAKMIWKQPGDCGKRGRRSRNAAAWLRINNSEEVEAVSMLCGGLQKLSRLAALGVLLWTSSSRAEIDIMGIDISHWQGDIDWSQVAADPKGIKFAFMKATEDTNYTDPTFNTNLAGATAAGILAGPYHFCRLDTNGGTAPDAINEANYFLSKIKTKYQTGQYLPPVEDVESFPSNNTQTLTSTWVDAFSDTVYAALGVRPLIYTSQSKATTLYTSAVASENPLWNAAWHTNGISSPPSNSSVSPWSAWKFWQWSNDSTSYPSNGPINGFASGIRVDRDVFQGTIAQLKSMLLGKDPNAKAGDFNRDGKVDTGDYNLWVSQNGKTVPMYTGADANGDTQVNSTDLSVWIANTPEPASGILALTGFFFSFLYTARHRRARRGAEI
jgi:GH25 family lysozyme M1 (1,4-beta-N-acetylmuramidase)